MNKVVYRDSRYGTFTTKQFAASHKPITEREVVKIPNKKGR